MTYGIDQMEYRNDTIPRDICFVHGDCNSVGSLTTNSLTYSEDEGVPTTSPKRWNCDVGLQPNARQRYTNTSKIPAAGFVPSNHANFRDPEFFPPLVPTMQSEQSLLERYDDDAENDKRRFSCNLFGTSYNHRISTHARMEMLRHQFSKPFRALPAFPTPPRIDATCIGKSILQSVANQVQNAGSLDCNKSRKLVQQAKEENDFQSVEKARFVPAHEEGYPSDEEMLRGKPRPTIKDSSPEKKNGQFNPISTSASQSFDFSIDKGELSLSSDTHWLSLVATDESSVEESAVVLKLELD